MKILAPESSLPSCYCTCVCLHVFPRREAAKKKRANKSERASGEKEVKDFLKRGERYRIVILERVILSYMYLFSFFFLPILCIPLFPSFWCTCRKGQ